MGLKKKLTDEMHKYVDRSLLPSCYVVYRSLLNQGKVVDQEEFNYLVLNELKCFNRVSDVNACEEVAA